MYKDDRLKPVTAVASDTRYAIFIRSPGVSICSPVLMGAVDAPRAIFVALLPVDIVVLLALDMRLS